MTPKQQQSIKQHFADYLTEPKLGETVNQLRKLAVRACVSYLGHERVSDLPHDKQLDLVCALLIPPAMSKTRPSVSAFLNSKPKPTPRSTPGPIFKTAHLDKLCLETGAPESEVIVFLEGKSEEMSISEIVSKMTEKRGDETRSYCAHLYGKLNAAYGQIIAEEADAKGELWHIRAAIYPERAFMVLRQGFEPDDWADAFESQHRATLGLANKRVFGNEMEAKVEALKLFRTYETTIRVFHK